VAGIVVSQVVGQNESPASACGSTSVDRGFRGLLVRSAKRVVLKGLGSACDAHGEDDVRAVNAGGHGLGACERVHQADVLTVAVVEAQVHPDRQTVLSTGGSAVAVTRGGGGLHSQRESVLVERGHLVGSEPVRFDDGQPGDLPGLARREVGHAQVVLGSANGLEQRGVRSGAHGSTQPGLRRAQVTQRGAHVDQEVEDVRRVGSVVRGVQGWSLR